MKKGKESLTDHLSMFLSTKNPGNLHRRFEWDSPESVLNPDSLYFDEGEARRYASYWTWTYMFIGGIAFPPLVLFWALCWIGVSLYSGRDQSIIHARRAYCWFFGSLTICSFVMSTLMILAIGLSLLCKFAETS